MIRYDEYGDASNPTIVLLHGAAALDTFSHQYGLASGSHLVIPHLPGAGDSVEQVYSLEVTRREVLSLIDSLGKRSVGIIGHSLGAQLAVALLCARPSRFSFGAFLSAWVNPRPEVIAKYLRVARLTAWTLGWGWPVRLQARYWGLDSRQAQRMADYSSKITPQVYASFFTETLDLSAHPEYQSLTVPMLAMCGDREVKDIKTSLELLGANPHCRTMIMPRAGHDFPMRRAANLNPILRHFITEHQSG